MNGENKSKNQWKSTEKIDYTEVYWLRNVKTEIQQKTISSYETEIYLLIQNKENYEKLYHNKLSVQFSQFKIMV